MALTPGHVDAFLAAKNVLTMQMGGHHHGSGVDQDAVAGVCQRLKALSQDIAKAPAAAAPPAPAAPDRSGEEADRLTKRRPGLQQTNDGVKK
ncbi:MAG: hypothetical protein M1449_07725, partial [Candidatus Thermoplasmatota archaeon]|nr:hypothetical protein [Candidatus Thermoplasmatota archaeon]